MPERSSAFGTWVKRFLMEYLPTERNLAINTLRSYRDGLTLLLPFVAERCRKPVERLAVAGTGNDFIELLLVNGPVIGGASSKTLARENLVKRGKSGQRCTRRADLHAGA